MPLSPGFDELAFGGALDGWSRTYRSTAWAVGTVSRHGLLVSGRSRLPARFDRTIPLTGGDSIEMKFAQLRSAYSDPTAQFEHPLGVVLDKLGGGLRVAG